MTKYAALLQFKDDATLEQIAAALNGIAHVVDVSHSGRMKNSETKDNSRPNVTKHVWVADTLPSDRIEAFNPDHGYPVFYIP